MEVSSDVRNEEGVIRESSYVTVRVLEVGEEEGELWAGEHVFDR